MSCYADRSFDASCYKQIQFLILENLELSLSRYRGLFLPSQFILREINLCGGTKYNSFRFNSKRFM